MSAPLDSALWDSPQTFTIILAIDVLPPSRTEGLISGLQDELLHRPHLINPEVFRAERTGWAIVRVRDMDYDVGRSVACVSEEVFEAVAAVGSFKFYRVMTAPLWREGEGLNIHLPVHEFTHKQQSALNGIGRVYGCHTCGVKKPGTVSGNFIPDMQSPSMVTRPDDPQELFPHCIECNRLQGEDFRHFRLYESKDAIERR
jgi:hypothetical protein